MGATFTLLVNLQRSHVHHVLRGVEIRTNVLGYFIYITRNTISIISMCSKLYHISYQALPTATFLD